MMKCSSIDGPMSFAVRGYEQTNLFSPGDDPHCTCLAFKFSKSNPSSCKHLARINHETCGWHEQYAEESQTEPGVCPRCGDPTVLVL